MRRLMIAAVAVFGMGGQAAADGYDTVRSALDSGDDETAYATLAEMGDAGDTLAAIMLANLEMSYAYGQPNFGVAQAWLEEAAAAGSIHAMMQLGSMHQFQAPWLNREWTMPEDGFGDAIHWFGRAADAGSQAGISRLGLLYRLGMLSTAMDPSMTRDEENLRADTFLSQAAADGRPEAMSGLALSVWFDDPERAGELMQQAAALGDPMAIGVLVQRPADFGAEDPVEVLAWALASEVHWELERNPRSEVFNGLAGVGVRSGADLLSWVAEQRSAAAPDVLAAAEAMAAQVSADWNSLLPGQSNAGQGGTPFGRD